MDPYNEGRAGLGWMRGWLRIHVYAACSDCVVCVCGGGGLDVCVGGGGA
jgi:hypothetical protein